MSEPTFDGDAALLLVFVLVGTLPVIGDALNHRAFGWESAVGMLVVLFAGAGLFQRVIQILRARRLGRSLLKRRP